MCDLVLQWTHVICCVCALCCACVVCNVVYACVLFCCAQGKIANYGTYGIVVRVNQYIHGLCPTLHLADVKLKHPEKKLKKGNEVRCRVRQRMWLCTKCMGNSTFPRSLSTSLPSTLSPPLSSIPSPLCLSFLHLHLPPVPLPPSTSLTSFLSLSSTSGVVC